MSQPDARHEDSRNSVISLLYCARGQHGVRLVVALLLGLFAGLPYTQAQNFTVNSAADHADENPGGGSCATGQVAPDGSGNPECTLRAAIQESNADSGAHTITLPAGNYFLTLPTQCSYSLNTAGGKLNSTFTPLCFTGQVTVIGAGASVPVIDAGKTDRAAWVSANAIVSLEGVTIQNGAEPVGDYTNEGGCINNEGTLSLNNVVVTGCFAINGGGIFNLGTLNIVGSSITGNEGKYYGGGILNVGTLFISHSTLNLNVVNFGGGAITNETQTGVLIPPQATITESTISGNQAGGGGGGLVNYSGTMVLTNTTISGNQSFNAGGGIQNFATLTMNSDTLAQNTAADEGGGIYTGAPFTIGNTIIAGNTVNSVESDCTTNGGNGYSGVSLGYNLIQNPGGCLFTGDSTTNITGVNPFLGALTNNGGPTQTMALQPASAALNAGSPSAPGSGGTACPITDQRGFFRPQGARCDIGAFEGTTGLSVSAISPAQGGSGGTVTAVISGGGIRSGATVQLNRAGQPSIKASPTAQDPGQASETGTFDLSAATLGAWDVVISNPDGTTATLPGGFNVTLAQTANIYVALIGRNAIRDSGQPDLFSILISNRGNVDALGVPIIVAAPIGFYFNTLFPILAPPANASQIYTNWAGVPTLVTTPVPTFDNLALLVPVVPAGYSGVLTFTLTVPQGFLAQGTSSFLMYAENGNPLFNSVLDPSVVSQLVANAQAYSASNYGVTIPDSLNSNLQSYVTTELQTAITNGRQDLVTSLGSQLDAYSQAQFLIDLASVGATEALTAVPANAAAKAKPQLQEHSSLRSDAAINVLARGPDRGQRAPKPNGTHITPDEACDPGNPFGPACGIDGNRLPTMFGSQFCTGGVMLPGTSCIPPPPTPPAGITLPPGCNPSKNILTNCNKLTPAACMQVGNHVTSDGSTCLPPAGVPCPVSVEASYFCRPFQVVSSFDPNDKEGPAGPGTANFLSGKLQPLVYNVAFENQSTASAPAQVVVITDQLDTANLDLSTFSIGPITFGNYQVLPVASQSQYIAGVDLRPLQNVQVKIQASLNQATGLLTWRFTSIDPDTGQLTNNPLAGFLPPNVNAPQGQGTVVFSILPKAATLASGTTCNRAIIVFDSNSPISTPTWCNSFDSTPPVSSVQALPATESDTNFAVAWSGSDAGSGIASYNIYASDNGGSFAPFQTATTAPSATFTGQVGHTYGFYSIATDLVGNVEGAKKIAEAKTQIPAQSSGTLAVSTTPSSGTVLVGQPIQFAITIANSANGAVTGATLTDALPGSNSMVWSLNPVYSGPGTCALSGSVGSQTLSCSFGSIAAAQSFPISLLGPHAAFGSYTNTAVVQADGSQTSSTATVTVEKLPSSFVALTASQAIYVGTSSITLSGSIGNGNSVPAAGETVSVTIHGITGTASIGTNGVFSVTVPTAAIPVATLPSSTTYSPYTITYSYSGDSTLSPATNDATSLTVKLTGDVNGDGVVSCLDLAIVKAAFGTRSGQAGFNPNADVNHDGVVNVLDLSIVARQLPAGTVCQ